MPLSDDLARKILEAGRASDSEEDLKMAVQRLLDDALKDLGLSYEVKYEKAIYKSRRADALYPTIVLEYKKPRALRSKKIREEAIDALGDYLRGMSKTETVPRKFVGIALDGENILFVRTKPLSAVSPRPRKRKQVQITLDGKALEADENDWDVIGPELISQPSIERLFLFFRALAYRIITPENLADDFGSESNTGKKIIGLLYKKLESSKNPKIQMLFEEWSRIFGVVYGQNLKKVKEDTVFFANIYELPENTNLQELLFSVHTYFALLMKMLAAETLALQSGSLFPAILQRWAVADDGKLRDELLDLENGGLFRRFGITNFLEGDFFRWYLENWDTDLSRAIREMALKLANYEPATSRLEPEQTKDLLKKLYQYLVPQKIRHDLGEYYTPDWLAELVLRETGYQGDPEKRALDPACGSGTFLVLEIKKIKLRVQDNPEYYKDRNAVLKQILNNVVGFDINPLAVLASRTNYLIAIADLPRTGDIEIPVYLCDSVLSPTEYASVFGKTFRITTAAGDFFFPAELTDKTTIRGVLDELDKVIELTSGKNGENLFIDRIKKAIPFEVEQEDENALRTLYQKIDRLEKEGKNRIWTNILKNNFAPKYVGKFDFVIGNPPWIRWGYLSDEYRRLTLAMWKDYGLFSLKGMEARLGGGEKDFSMLFTYAAIDFYLKDDGKIGFLITQEVFKAKGAGQGFRRFKIGTTTPFKILKVHDLVKIKPFEKAGNKTSFFVAKKGEKTTYPIPYFQWTSKGKVNTDLPLEKAIALMKKTDLIAKPIDKRFGSWLTIPKESEVEFNRLMGRSKYSAFRGASVDPYGVYFVEIKSKRSDGKLIIENVHDLGKKKIKRIQETIESDLVFPAIRGCDIKRWRIDPKFSVIIPQNPEKRTGYDENWMINNLPDTYRYFLRFKEILLEKALYWKYFSMTITSTRKLSNKELLSKGKYYRLQKEKDDNGKKIFTYQISTAPFYTIFNVGSYSFSPYRVVWCRMSNDMRAAVVCSTNSSPEKIPVATDTTSFASLESESEAHYLCALLNSTLVRRFIGSFSSAGRGFAAPSILNHLRLPKFTDKNKIHLKLVELSVEAHNMASSTDIENLKETEHKIDEYVHLLFS